VEAFAFIGETLRRLRKELGKTMEDLGAEAGLGRGQLSRIENARQEATLSTLAKILASQGVSRTEFFRRYDLVEGEAYALGRTGPTPESEAGAEGGPPESVRELQDLFGRFGSWFRSLPGAQALAQGSIEVGDFVLSFQIAAKRSSVVPLPGRVAGAAKKAGEPKPAARIPDDRKLGRKPGSGRKKQPPTPD
jgi:transcriptional regulator with XRE-family HTH domain